MSLLLALQGGGPTFTVQADATAIGVAARVIQTQKTFAATAVGVSVSTRLISPAVFAATAVGVPARLLLTAISRSAIAVGLAEASTAATFVATLAAAVAIAVVEATATFMPGGGGGGAIRVALWWTINRVWRWISLIFTSNVALDDPNVEYADANTQRTEQKHQDPQL